MKCPVCGNYIPDGSDFCDNCGTFIKEDTTHEAKDKNDILADLFSPQITPVQEKKKMKPKVNIDKKTLVIIAVFALIAIVGITVPKIGRRRGIAGIGEPVQEEAYRYFEKEINGYEVSIYANYSYEIEALVVHTKNYYGFGLDDRLAPRDIALAWGKVAEYNDKINFHWSQHGRWVYWKVNSYDELDDIGGEDYVACHLSNNHLIPADKSVKRKIKKIKKGDHIKITGYLVNVDAENERGKTYFWNSSTTRYDTGDGACEVIYVTDIVWID
ncbi:MAG: zinc ribbon domain-containing protein [Lachnospiraceae bacterium]|nr:zinc ribbon domain-containing protein [Lachnospiraceae bacterium]